MRALITGCGYVGLELGRRLLAAGHTVAGLRRTSAGAAELRAAGLEPIVGDVTRAADLRPLAGRFDWIANCVSSSGGGVDEYREVYLGGMQRLVEAFSGTGVRAFVYTSSTSVYGQADGGWVGEESATEPAAETGRVLLETERVLRVAAGPAFPAMIVRVAGIYGPERGHLFRQFLRGEARSGPDDARWMNMIHRDDVAGAVEACLARGTAGRAYNACDDEPVTRGDFLRWLAKATGRSFPKPGDLEPIAYAKRGLTDKRVSNHRLRAETGWEPRYPTFRQGYAAMLVE